MLFFSGFSLKNEDSFFNEYIDKSDFSVCGFSYGGIKAFEYTLNALKRGERIDRLQLFSPAFFQSKDMKFKRLQLLSYKKNQSAYLREFRKACFAPYSGKQIEESQTTSEELKELLEYEWSLPSLQQLQDKGVVIEVYLGSEDKIVDTVVAQEFFIDIATVTYIKRANHFLQIV